MTAREAPAPIRMVAVDLDGTLLRSDHSISGRCVRAIHAAAERGVRVVLASARPPRSVRRLGMALPFDPLQIHYNGALIHDRDRGRHVFHQPLLSRLAQQIVRCARKVDSDTLVSIEMLDKWYTDRHDDRFGTATSREFSPDFIGPLDAFLHKPVTKLMFAGPPERLGAVKAAIAQRFEARVKIVVSDAHLIQVVHPDVDKAHALARIATQHNIAAHEVMAIGDAPNDNAMLKWAGVGVAMANGWSSTREAVRTVAPSNDDDGVAWAIDRFVLGVA